MHYHLSSFRCHLLDYFTQFLYDTFRSRAGNRFKERPSTKHGKKTPRTQPKKTKIVCLPFCERPKWFACPSGDTCLDVLEHIQDTLLASFHGASSLAVVTWPSSTTRLFRPPAVGQVPWRNVELAKIALSWLISPDRILHDRNTIFSCSPGAYEE